MDHENHRPICIPTANQPQYQAARAVDPYLADKYMAHTTVGDPLADATLAELSNLARAESYLYIEAGMENNLVALRDAPAMVREFFSEASTPPDWLHLEALMPGVRLFHRNSPLVLAGMVGGVLVEGFASNISKAFFISGRLRDQGVARLKQNNRHMVEIFMPHGLERFGDGWKLSIRIRLVHARVRQLLKNSDEWDSHAWGVPISAAHLGLAISAFSARLLRHAKSLGAVYDDEERASFMAAWRYSGYLMGIPESILFRDEADALSLFEMARLCEPEPDSESIVMAHALLNSAPLVVGITDSDERRNMAKYVFSVSRALVGNNLADKLAYPPVNYSQLVLPWFRFQSRYSRFLDRVTPPRLRSRNHANFQALLDTSAYLDTGIGYALPNHVYAEESSHW